MEEIKLKYYKVRSLPSITKPNSVYYVKDQNEDSVTSYITGKDCIPYPLVDATSFSAATEWSANHSTETGNPYTIGTHVFWNGHIYRCKYNNDGIPTTDSTYWLDLGVGYLLAEEQSDFEATTGRAFIKNKPTKTSDFINDGEDGTNPFITLEDIPVFDSSDYDLEDFTNNSVDPFAKISDLPVYSDFIQNSITNGVVNKAPTENAVYDALQLKQDIIGYTPVNKAGDTMLGNLILNQDPTNALQAATKQYVDTIALGINFHAPVRVATTGNLNADYDNGINGVGASLTGVVLSSDPLEIDTITLEQGDRVLVWQQIEEHQNGIYEVTDAGNALDPFILTRTSDADNSPIGEIVAGDYVLALTGYNNGGYGFICNTPGTILIGTTGIIFVQFNAAQAVTAGYGLREIVSNVISINPDETQEKITLTTTGSSGAATFVGNTLNIPQYSGLQNLQQVVNSGNGISNYGGTGIASIQSTNFINNRTLYLNSNSNPTIKFEDNLDGNHYITFDIDTLDLNGVFYDWSDIVSTKDLQNVLETGNFSTTNLEILVDSTIGIKSTSTTNVGVYGESTDNAGVFGRSTNSDGVYATTTNGNALALRVPSTGTPFLIKGTRGATVVYKVNHLGELTATKIVKEGGSPSEYLMADGSTTTGSPGGGATNLGYTPSATNGVVTSDTGTDATIPLADATNAGLLKPAKFTVLENTSGSNTGDQDLSNLVVKNTAITGATKTKITYDSKGLVTSGQDLSASDIPTIAQTQVTNLTTDLSSKIAKNVGTTYTTNAIATVTAAEYAAIGTKDPNTLYFII